MLLNSFGETLSWEAIDCERGIIQLRVSARLSWEGQYEHYEVCLSLYHGNPARRPGYSCLGYFCRHNSQIGFRKWAFANKLINPSLKLGDIAFVKHVVKRSIMNTFFFCFIRPKNSTVLFKDAYRLIYFWLWYRWIKTIITFTIICFLFKNICTDWLVISF